MRSVFRRSADPPVVRLVHYHDVPVPMATIERIRYQTSGRPRGDGTTTINRRAGGAARSGVIVESGPGPRCGSGRSEPLCATLRRVPACDGRLMKDRLNSNSRLTTHDWR